MRIQHNIMAMNAYRNYTNNTSALSKNLEKLSSGYRINRAGDDAAGLAISEKMRAQITGLSAAQKNVKDGISLVKTAEGATQEIHDMLNRMVYLAEQSANGTYQDEVDREAITNEFTQLKSEIDRIADSSNFNGIKLLDGSLATTGKAASLAEADLSKVTGALAGTIKTVDPVKGEYQNMTAIADVATDMAEGDSLTATFNVTDANGKTQNISVSLSIAKDSAGKLTKLVAEDGTEYSVTEKKPTGQQIGDAIKGELVKNSTIKENFTVDSATAGVVKLLAKQGGTDAMTLTGFEYKTTVKATGVDTVVTNGAKTNTQAKDAFEVMDLSKGKIWLSKDADKGDNDLSKCAFEVNGEKFVFVEKGMINADNLAKLKEAGIEHYVEVATDSTIANGDVTKMAEKISMETGLSVETGTSTTTNGITTWAGSVGGTTGTEIGLKSRSNDSTKSGGLTLQIGDTSDKFNQLTVSVGDMHVKALGIAGLDLGTQSGAQAAVQTIKDAINYVSQERGTLGATQNRLEHTSNNLSVMKENIQDAESSIRDTDIAEEMMAYTKNNILVQSAQAMLAQANQIPQGVLQLLG